jgi:uncharacterized protein YukE
MAELTDERPATPQEARLFAERHDAVARCATAFLNAASTVRPDIVPAFAEMMTASNVNAVAIVERQITWGELARRGQANLTQLKTNLAAADQRWLGELKQEHQAELAQRQAAAAALSQWAQQQQMINAMNQPVLVAPARHIQTNCTRMGAFANCTTY